MQIMASVAISIAALVVSTFSLIFTVYFNLRDRPRLKVTSRYFPGVFYGDEYVLITALNVGRRPVFLKSFGGEDNAGLWIARHLHTDCSGLRLGENERYEIRLKRDDLIECGPDDDIEFYDIWIEDSLGKRHRVKNAKTNIAKLRGKM